MAAAAVSSPSRLVFCPPCLGKPSESGGHTWVVVQGSQANACWDAALDLIRTHADSTDKEKRRLEGLALARRRAVEEHEESLPVACHILNYKKMKDAYTTYTKASCELLLELGVIKNACPDDIVRAFQKQKVHKNLYDYLVHLKMDKRDNINLAYLKEFKKDPAELYRVTCHSDWQQCNITQQSALLDSFARLVIANNYGFQFSRWFPGAPIEQLIETLETEGAIFIVGHLQFRDVKVVKSDRMIGYRHIWVQLANQESHLGVLIGHSVVLVGACSIRSEVYYVDPSDDSDPQHPEKQKIIAISYDTLTALNVIGKHGRIFDVLGRGYATYSRSAHYGFYYPKDKRESDFHALFVALDTLRAQVGKLFD